MGGHRIDVLKFISRGTAWFGRLRFPFPIFFFNHKLEIQACAQMLEWVLYLLIMEVISLCNTKTMWTYSAKIEQTLMHCTGQLTMWLVCNKASIHDMAKSTTIRDWSWKLSMSSLKRFLPMCSCSNYDCPWQHQAWLWSTRIADCDCVWTINLFIKPWRQTYILFQWSRRFLTGCMELRFLWN